MYAKISLLLTLLIFVNIEILSANDADAHKTKVSLPIEIENEETEIEAKSTAVDETTITLPLSDAEVSIGIETTTGSDAAPTSDEEMPKGRSITGNYDDDTESARPLKNVLRGIYKSYKSTYMGNSTSAEYKKRLIERLNAASTMLTPSMPSTTSNPTTLQQQSKEVINANERLKKQTSLIALTEATPLSPPALDRQEVLKVKLIEKQRKRKRKYKRSRSGANKRTKVNNHLIADNTNENNDNNNSSYISYSTNSISVSSSSSSDSNNSVHTIIDELHDKHYRYSIGPGVNLSFDMLNDIVNVNLDGDNLREIMRGRWLSDNTEEGRGKKYDMVTKVLPLFVLPFLIQSAIVPFLVTKLKLLLVKSILIGKLAIFLLIISAIKNSNKMVQSYEVAPSYWAGEPSRRSELAAAAAATSTAYNGYRVEGKPAAWIN